MRLRQRQKQWLLSAFLLFFTLAGLAQGITLTLTNAPLEKAFREMEARIDQRFVYTREMLYGTRPVTLTLQNATLHQALNQLFEGQPLDYTLDDLFIKVRYRPTPPPPSTGIDIRGVVRTDNGDPLEGATIQVKGSARATTTAADGTFTLNDIQEKSVLLISYVGYTSQELPLQGRTTLEIHLQPSVTALDETVVIAYGTTTQRLNTGSVGKITAGDISRQPVANPLAALQSRIPGLDIVQTSGMPGAAFKVLLRGQNSLLQGSEPLYIIDGVPLTNGNVRMNQITIAADLSPLSTINPADIESIEILKDADATAIYGSRGANGVILISTKKGKEGKTAVGAHLSHSFGRVTRTMNLLNTTQYLQMRREAFNNDGTTPTPASAPDLFLWDTSAYTDFKELLIGGTANVSNAQLTLSGGSATTRFSLGSAYLRETTVFPGSLSSQRASAHLSLQHQPLNGKLSLNLSALYSAAQSNLIASDLATFINLPPHLQLYDSTGALNWTQAGSSFQSLALTNPLAGLQKKFTGLFDNGVANLQLDYRLRPSLLAKASLGFSTLNSDEVLVNPATSFDPAAGQRPFASFGNGNQKSWIAEPQLHYTKNFRKHRFQLLAGATWQQHTARSSNTNGTDYSSDLLLNSIEAAGKTTIFNDYSRYRYQGWFGRLNYRYNDRYILNASGRRDGSSKFGPANRFNNFGALGGAWIFSQYKSMGRRLPFLSFGKLRTSYGITGNDQIANYQFLNTWSVDPLTYQGATGLLPSRLYNPHLAWERNRKMEGGIDLGFWKDRLLLSVAAYRNRSDNQLISYALPAQTGFPSVSRNFDALLQNTGWELSLRSRNIKTTDLEWTSTLNLTRSRNKLLRFPGLATSSYAHTYVIGQPVTVRKLYRSLGVDAATGLYTFEDADHDGALSTVDRVVLQHTNPAFFGGVQNTLSFKGLELDLFFDFKKQVGLNYLFTQGFNVPGYGFKNQPGVVLHRWQAPGDRPPVQQFTANAASPAFTAASRYLSESDAVYSDASFIRCRNLSLSWRPSRTPSATRPWSSLALYLQARNLFTITSYKGADPENQNLYVLPPLKTLTLGLNLQF